MSEPPDFHRGARPAVDCFRYRAYGLQVTADRAIPGLAPASQSKTTDLEISFAPSASWLPANAHETESEWYRARTRNAQGDPVLIIRAGAGRSHFRFLYDDGTEFHVDGAGSRVWADWKSPLTFEDTLTYLVAPIIGFVLRLRGITCLHASAAVIDGKAIAFVGSAGAGKSTTAAAFARLGFSVVTDDVLALEDRGSGFDVHGGYTHVRLWPASQSILFDDGRELPRLTPGWEKRYLDLSEHGDRFAIGPIPLGGVYLLGDRADDERALTVEHLAGVNSVIHLVGNTYTHSSLELKARTEELTVLARLANAIPVRRIIPHRDPARIWSLCETVIREVRG
jgi:hypothetical protein